MSLIQKTNEDRANRMIEYENKRELMDKLELVVGPIDKNLRRLVDLLDRCKKSKSAQALDVELRIIQYIDSLRWIKPETQKKALTVSVFSYNSNWDQSGIKADLEF